MVNSYDLHTIDSQMARSSDSRNSCDSSNQKKTFFTKKLFSPKKKFTKKISQFFFCQHFFYQKSIVTKLNQIVLWQKKLWQLWQNPDNQIVTKLKNSNYDKMRPNSKKNMCNIKKEIVLKFENSNCDKT